MRPDSGFDGTRPLPPPKERQHAVGMHDLGAEHRAVPLHQLIEATRSSHDVGQALWLHDGTLAIEAIVSIFNALAFLPKRPSSLGESAHVEKLASCYAPS